MGGYLVKVDDVELGIFESDAAARLFAESILEKKLGIQPELIDVVDLNETKEH